MNYLSKGLLALGNAVIKHGPELLTALGIVGLVGAGVKAVKNTPEASKIIEDEEERNEKETTTVEKIKLCWKFYIFPVVIAFVSILCILGARHIDAGRTAALMTACKMSEQAAERFESATREVVSDKTMTKIQDRVSEKIVKETPYVEDDVIDLGTAGPKQLFFECYSRRYIRCTRDYIDKAINEFNKQLLNYDTMTLNDYLDCFNIPNLDQMTTGALEWQLDDVKRRCGGRLPELIFKHGELETGEYYAAFRLEIDPTYDLFQKTY